MRESSTTRAWVSRVALAAACVLAVTWLATRLADAQGTSRGGGGRDGGARAADGSSARDGGDDGAPDAGDGGDAASTDAADPDAESLDSRRMRAGDEFALGLADYRRGEFLSAAGHFEAAYRALPDPAPLFNLARSLEGANEVQRAIEAYERYMAESTDARGRAEVRDRVALLRSRPTQVFLSTEPPGAVVFVDEDPNPQPTPTPLVLRISPGPHVVVLEREGYRRTVRRIVARSGEIETLSVALPADAGEPVGGGSANSPRVLNRRQDAVVSGRVAFLMGAARAWNGDPFHLSLGGDATLFIGRSLALKFHFERIEPDGVWTVATGDFGYVFLLEDLDLGVFATAGVGYGAMDRSRPAELSFVPVAGLEARLEWMFHPRLALGFFLRATWRNFFIAPIEPLNSLGGSVSLSF